MPSLLRLVAAFVGAALAASAAAQPVWKPERPVTLVVPYNAGGGTDASARAVAKQLSVVWNQPVVVENAPGADGLIGTRRVIDARPDGYTLLVQIPSLALIKYQPALKGYDPLPHLEPVTVMSKSPAIVVSNAQVPGKTMGELARHCKSAQPPCSSGTTENIARIASRMLASDIQAPDLIVVNYKGGGGMIADLLSNQVNMSFMGLAAALPHYKAGKLNILAVMDKQRTPFAPEVPTTAEAGFPDYLSVTWFGLFAPKGTPAPVVEGIAAAVREAVRDKAIVDAFASAGAEPVANSPQEFAELVRAEEVRLGNWVKRFPLQ